VKPPDAGVVGEVAHCKDSQLTSPISSCAIVTNNPTIVQVCQQ